MARRIRALTPARVDDLPEPCAGCVFWESRSPLPPECGSACDAEELRQWVSRVLTDWGDCGRIAYLEGDAIGFVRYAPARYLPQAECMPAGPPSSDAVLLACMHVEADVRHAGLGKVLLQATLRDLVTRGERAIEAYATAQSADRTGTPLITVEFLLRQGFTVLRPHPAYPLMRLELRTLAAWTENLEAALEALQLPLIGRERVPAPLAGSR